MRSSVKASMNAAVNGTEVGAPVWQNTQNGKLLLFPAGGRRSRPAGTRASLAAIIGTTNDPDWSRAPLDSVPLHVSEPITQQRAPELKLVTQPAAPPSLFKRFQRIWTG
jgi:hypothetical protein